MPPSKLDASPAGERRRELLQRYGLLERVGDPHLERLIRVTAATLGVPVALLAVSDGDDFFLVSAVGPSPPWTTGTRIGAAETFCALALESVDGFVLDDARTHPSRCTGLIDGAPVATYAGIPLLLEGHPVGVLCVAGAEVRRWSLSEQRNLEDLAAAVVREWTLGLANLSSLRAALDSERFRSLSAGAFDAIAIHHRGILVEVNDAVVDLVGHPREELIGRFCLELLVPEDREPARERIMSLSDESHEYRVLHRDGGQLHVEVRSKPITFDGRTMRLMVIRDLTREHAATRALQESEALLRGIADSVEDPIFAKNLEGQYIFANVACAELHGMRVEDIVGQSTESFAPRGKAAGFRQTDRRVFTKGESVQIEDRVEEEGRQRIFLATKSPLRLPSGELLGLVGVARDITALKSVEDALRDQSERLAAVVRAQQEIAVAGLDREAVLATIAQRAQELTRACGAVVELVEAEHMVYGVATGALASYQGLRLDRDGSLSGLCARQGEPLVCEDTEDDPRVDREAARRIGARSMLLVPLTAGGPVIGVLKVVSSRPAAFGESERHMMALMAGLMGASLRDAAAYEAEQVLHRELEHSNAALADFAKAASHDLQEPLRKIRAFGNRLLTRHAESLDPDGQLCAERMEAAASRMQALIDDLLEFARTTRGLPPLQAVELGSVVDRALLELAEPIEESGASIEVGPLPAVLGHPTQLRQLLRNLLSNALKFHRPSQPPRVRISATLSVQAGADGGWVELRVEDEGIGFEPEYAARIFEIFERLHGRSAYPGTGIGLALCKRIVEHHRGTIHAESRPGQGATFIVVLPAATSKAGVSNGEGATLTNPSEGGSP